jgi:hypothetical protein
MALYGHSLGLFLVDALIKAIEGLGPNDYDPAAKVQELKAMEDKDYDKFFASTISHNSSKLTKIFPEGIWENIDPMTYFRKAPSAEPHSCRQNLDTRGI